MAARSPLEIVAAIGARANRLRDDISELGSVKGDQFIDAMLEIRALAREATDADAFADTDEPHRRFRLAMVQMELAIDHMIEAQPDATPEQDQELVDLIFGHYNALEPFLSGLEASKPTLH